MTYSGHGDNQQAWDSDYDSTWEEDEGDEQPKTETDTHQFNSQRRAAQDLQKYRHGYPDTSPKLNLLFYQNKIPFKPNGEYIDKMHKCWRNNYDMLEDNHNFIQWLFPLQEHGVNHCAAPLTEREIQLMKSDEAVMKRLLESYKLMLGFYGIVLLDSDTGKVARAKEIWKDRFKNLNNNTHNNLRITRILKCLGEMGYERFQAPLVRFFLKETLCNGNLPNVKISALDYFMFTVKDKKQRRNLVHFAWVCYKPQNRFRWGPVEKLRKFIPPLQNEEQDDEVDISEELKTPMIPSKKDSSEGYYAKDKEIARREPMRDYGLVRRTVDYVFMFFFRLLFSPFLVFGRLFGRFSSFFRGGISWFRRMAANKDRSNEEQISVKTEGTRTEKTKSERLLTDPEKQKRQEIEFKALNVSADVKTDNSIDESETEAKLKTEGNGSKCEIIPKDGIGSADRKPLVNIEMPKNKQAKEDNNTENKDDSRNFTRGKNVMELNEGQTSENDRLEGAEKCSVKEDNAGNGKGSGGGREHGGTQIANAGNQKGGTKIYNWNSKDEDPSRVKLVPLFSGSTVWSGDNDGGIIGTQKTLSQKDKTDQVERDYTKNKDEEAANANLSPQFGEVGDENENPGISKIDDSRGTLVLGSGDNDGGNIGAQNTMLETNKTEQVDRDDGKTKDEEAANVKLKPQFGEDKNPGTHKIEDNRETLVLGSRDNGEGNIGAQNTLLETDKTDQVDGDEGKTKDEKAANVKLSPQFSEDKNPGTHKIEDNRETLVLGSVDNGEGNIGEQNTLLKTDTTDQVDGDKGKTKDEKAANVKLPPQFGEGDEVKNPGTHKIENNRGTLVLGSVDNDGGNIGIQNTLPEVDKTNQFERDDGKTKDEEAASVKLSPHFGEVGDEDADPGIIKIEDNRGTLVLGSGDNGEGNIGAQNTLPETDKTNQFERDDGKTKDEEAVSVKLSPHFGEEGNKDKNPGINKIEDNRGTLVLGSGDNDGENIGAQNT